MSSLRLCDLFGGAYAGRRVLVTGATGFKGSWLCSWLREMGASVAGISLDLPSEPCHFTATGLSGDIRDHRLDVREAAAVDRVFAEFRPEVVFHLAAQALVRRSYRDPVGTFSTNVMGSVHVLDAIRRSTCVSAAVMVTSDKAYENLEQVAGYREEDRLGGRDPYSASKGCAELAFSAYARSFFRAPNRWLGEVSTSPSPGPCIASGRAGNVVGGGDWAEDRVVPDCVRAWMRAERPVVRSPMATRPWQHVLEPLSGYLWLAARMVKGDHHLLGDSFNFGPGVNVNETVASLIEALRLHWPEATAPELQCAAPSAPEAGLLRLDCTRAARILAWRSTLDFGETARFTASWYRCFQVNPQSVRAFTRRQILEYAAMAKSRGLLWANC